MQEIHYNITAFLLITTLLVLILGGFILTILFLYPKKQITYQKELESIKSEYEKTLLNTQLEIQEQTFQNISREIHDHICLNLTLAKLNLVTLNPDNRQQAADHIGSSIDILGKSIHELSNISHSMNPEVIESYGLIKALEMELEKMKKPELFRISFNVTGNPVFMDSQKELVIFRIVQEAFNNILKHAKANRVLLQLYYNEDHMEATVQDDGAGFIPGQLSDNGTAKHHSGLINMKKRAQLINGSCAIDSQPGKGTTIQLSIPY
jgi:two-component system NarL family sensor kinase